MIQSGQLKNQNTNQDGFLKRCVFVEESVYMDVSENRGTVPQNGW